MMTPERIAEIVGFAHEFEEAERRLYPSPSQQLDQEMCERISTLVDMVTELGKESRRAFAAIERVRALANSLFADDVAGWERRGAFQECGRAVLDVIEGEL